MEFTQQEAITLTRIIKNFTDDLAHLRNQAKFGIDMCIAWYQSWAERRDIEMERLNRELEAVSDETQILNSQNVTEDTKNDLTERQETLRQKFDALGKDNQALLIEDEAQHEKAFRFIDDLLRSLTVHLHASFEMVLREMLRICIPKGSENALDKIPYVDAADNRATKVSLGTLSKHRDKTIDAYIRDSVDKYLTEKSFNKVTDIVSIFKDYGFDLGPASNEYAPYVQEMIERRHKIVHERDMSGPPENRQLTPIVLKDYSRWAEAVSLYVLCIFSAITGLPASETPGYTTINQKFLSTYGTKPSKKRKMKHNG